MATATRGDCSSSRPGTPAGGRQSATNSPADSGQQATDIERAWRCQHRLYQRWQPTAGRGKPQQKIVVACARELAGVIWAIATNQPLRNA